MMLHYGWPGNVRELDHTIERAVLMARGERIEAANLGLNAQRGAAQSMDEMSLEAVEAILIRKALARANGNVSHAADALGLSSGSAVSSHRKIWALKTGRNDTRRRPAAYPCSAGKSGRRLSFERRLRLWLYLLGLPLALLCWLLLRQYSVDALSNCFVLLALVLGWAFAVSILMEQIVRPLQTLANVVAAPA